MTARSALVLSLALGAGCHPRDPAPAAAALEPWQPIDPSFKGCEGG